MQNYREVRQTGAFGKFIRFIFFAFNALMFIGLIVYWVEIGNLAAPMRSGERTVVAIGATVGTTMLLFLWAVGSVILGLLVMASRGPKLLIPIETAATTGGRWIVLCGIAIGIVMVVVLARSPTPSDPKARRATTERAPATPNEAPIDPATVKVAVLNWRKDGFGTVMIADFRIDNKNSFPVKDIQIRCSHYAPSGTMIDQDTRTVYQTIGSHNFMIIHQQNMGLVQEQVTKTNCETLGFSRY